MKLKAALLTIFAIILSVLIVMFDEGSEKVHNPITCYQVYLKGESLGLIKSENELLDYIDNQQKILKDKYHVDKIHIPNDIQVVKDITYKDNLTSVESIYNKINEKSPFTVKGYTIKIDRTDSLIYQNDDNEVKDKNNIIYVNVIDKKIFEDAVKKVILSFVDEESYNMFVNDEKITLESTGEVIENIYIDDNITIQETNISTNEEIFMDVDELTKYLIFTDNDRTASYTVKAGDTVEKVADKNNMSINELLIANDDIKSENTLLYIGQSLSVGTLDPVFSTIVEKHIVSDQTVKYKTKYEYDNNMYQGQTKTKQQGINGVNRVTQKAKFINGEISEAVITNTEELVPVVNRVVVKGGKQIARGDGEWLWPTNFPYIISSRYGWRWGHMHTGVDIAGTGRGSPIYAARAGVVTEAKYDGSRGYHVIIKHDNGYYTQYMHMRNIKGGDGGGSTGSYAKYITVGQRVQAHQVIGEVGSSGSSSGPHLHFEIWDGKPYQGGQTFNPLLYY